MKTTMRLLALLVLLIATFGEHTSAGAVTGPVFVYPTDGQILDYEGSYLFKVQPMASAEGFLWSFFQNGVMVWENLRDEGTLSGNEYGIHPGSRAHSKFVSGPLEVRVRALISGQWTEATVITIHLRAGVVTVTASGTANPWLAGMPDGTLSHFGDGTPANSPAQVLALTITPGESIFFSATGLVRHGPPGDPLIETSGPDGGTKVIAHDFGPENGISDIRAPVNALLGVFLGPNQPDQATPPGALDFGTAASRNYLSLSPQLRQVFFIGNGSTGTGQLQEIVIPAGATRLFLGPMDASQYHNNEGSFTVKVSDPPNATTLVSPSGSLTNTSPTYTWNKVSDATWYYLRVSRVNTDGSLTTVHNNWYQALEFCGSSACSARPGLTLSGGNYRWWVQTWNHGGYGPWSSAMNFSLPTIPPPGTATLVSPSGSITDTTPEYRWNKVSGAEWYYLWVKRPSGDPVKLWYQASAVCGASTCKVTPSASLGGGAHTWWIQTWNAGSGYGPWSDGMNFSLPVPTAPGATTLVSPTGNISDTTPVYTWNKVSGAEWYYLWVNGPGGNGLVKIWYEASAVCGASTCQATPPTALAAGSHTWWVQTWNPAGYGPWSVGKTFVISP